MRGLEGDAGVNRVFKRHHLLSGIDAQEAADDKTGIKKTTGPGVANR